jgi:hypothetical protein
MPGQIAARPLEQMMLMMKKKEEGEKHSAAKAEQANVQEASAQGEL